MRAPGEVRDAIVEYLSLLGTDAGTAEIQEAVLSKLGDVPASSVRSYLGLNTPHLFERTAPGRYRLKANGSGNDAAAEEQPSLSPVFVDNLTRLYQADCFAWLTQQPERSIQAVVTDPPYGLVEYTAKEQDKLHAGRGGIWRVPPSFDGHQRAPLPRFTVLDHDDRAELHAFFKRLAILLRRVTVPGANVVVASNPLLAHIVAGAMSEGGLELRGYIARLVMTMRGGDRPKNAHKEFSGVSVMPRSMWEPWVVLRNPLEGRVQDNLRRWGTGGFRRPAEDKPFGDVIRSSPTPAAERKIAPHPSLKPQAVLRHIVRASLALGEGVVLDPFAGSGSTLAAACAVGYPSVGVEIDNRYVRVATKAIPALAALSVPKSEQAILAS
jgi:site-specific DNA-methyltransferase (adenine-specific)